MMHRVRLALHEKETMQVGGPDKEVEVDETFIGGAARFMHSDKRSKVILARGTKGKAAVIGILERGGKVRAESLHGRKRHELETKVRAHIKAGSAIYSDNFASYDRLNDYGYRHAVVDHAERYVDGQVHTNGLENFWSLLKRGLKGTYVNVEPFHLFRYLDEQVFRYNNRAKKDHFVGDGDRFQMAMRHIAGRRITYQELTGKGTDSIHHEEAGTRPS